MDVLDALANVLQAVRSEIQAQPCRCQVTGQGLQRCRRCLLLEAGGRPAFQRTPHEKGDDDPDVHGY